MGVRKVAIRLLSVLLLCKALTATAQVSGHSERKFPLQVQFWSLGGDLSANHDAFARAGEYVIEDAAQFSALWQRAFVRSQGLPEEPPYIDFVNEMVIVLAMGQRPTGGNSIQARSVIENNDAVQVMYASRFIGRNCIVTQAFESPVEIIRIKRRSKPIEFYNHKSTHDCDPVGRGDQRQESE